MTDKKDFDRQGPTRRKNDRQEVKNDRQEVKNDRQEVKNDRQERNLTDKRHTLLIKSIKKSIRSILSKGSNKINAIKAF